jgi:hypothetical protein
MARFTSLMWCFHISLALLLATLAVLAVPERAFADTGSCGGFCSSYCDGDPVCLNDCNAACEDGYGDCSNCSEYSGANQTYCMAGCDAAQGTAMCDSACNGCTRNTFCDGKVGLDWLLCVSVEPLCSGTCSAILTNCRSCSCRDADPKQAELSCGCY